MTQVHPNALKHGIDEADVVYAWDNYLTGAVRVPGEREVRLGFDRLGREIEMVGVLLADGDWLVYHALTPPTKKVLDEVERAQRRS